MEKKKQMSHHDFIDEIYEDERALHVKYRLTFMKGIIKLTKDSFKKYKSSMSEEAKEWVSEDIKHMEDSLARYREMGG